MDKTFPVTVDEVYEWVSKSGHSVLAIDLETDGLYYGCMIKGISLCNGVKACYINFEEFKDSGECFAIALIKTLLETGVDLLIGHNLAFDLKVLKYHGVNYTGKIYDTLVSSHLLNENKSCALKELAVRVLKVPQKDVLKFKEASDEGYSSKKFLNYAINDVIWTWKLFELTTPLLEKQGLNKLFYEIEMPFQFVLIDLESNGILIDKDKLEVFQEVLLKAKEEFKNKTFESVGMCVIKTNDLFGFEVLTDPINLNSGQQVAEVIKERLGIKLPMTEPSKTYPEGQPATDKKTLEPLKKEHQFIESLLQYKSVEKLLNTFINPLFELVYDDGRIRTSFNDCIARTGRLSSSKPDLQNIPKKVAKDAVVNVRELFIPEKGNVFVRADYDSQELRQLANVTKDKNLIAAFNENKDLHLFTARNCLGLDFPEEYIVKTHPKFEETKKEYKEERHIGKNGINFPIIYGSTAYGIARNNGVTEEVAQSWLDGFFEMYPGVKMSLKKCREEIFRNHCVRNYFGRKRRLYDPSPKAIRQGFNYWIQGFCSDLLRMTLTSLRQLYIDNPQWGAKLVLTVHDDVLTECREEYAQELLKAKKEIMENVIHFEVPFLVEIGVCNSYGE